MEKLMADKTTIASVFDNLKQMVAAQLARRTIKYESHETQRSTDANKLDADGRQSLEH